MIVDIPAEKIPWGVLGGFPPLPFAGAGITLPHAPEGAGEGGGASLVPLSSITVTANKVPSDIAKEALNNLGSIDPEYQNCHDFVEYLLLCDQKGFRIKGYDTKKGKIVSYPLSYNNRWGPVRRSILSEKLERLQFWWEAQEDRPVTMVTLTSHHKGYSIAGAWQELNKSRDKLRKLIFKYFGAVDYFWVVEPHKKGYAHYHLAVFAAVDNYTRDSSKYVGWVKCRDREDEDIWEILDGRGIEDKFRDLWSKKYNTGDHTYGLDFSQKKGDAKIQHLKNYLQKYLSKGFLLDKWTPGMLKFNAAMWETRFRMYGASRTIREIMNIFDDKPDQTVWLETKVQEPAVTPEGIEYESERVVWYRQYIPDWLDSDFWLYQGQIRQGDPPAQYIYDWGRKATYRAHLMDIPVVDWKSIGFRRRKPEVDPYEQFNKNYRGKNNVIP